MSETGSETCIMARKSLKSQKISDFKVSLWRHLKPTMMNICLTPFPPGNLGWKNTSFSLNDTF